MCLACPLTIAHPLTFCMIQMIPFFLSGSIPGEMARSSNPAVASCAIVQLSTPCKLGVGCGCEVK